MPRLEQYLREQKIVQAIVFCNSRHGGEKLVGQLQEEFDSVDFIHGGLEQARRTMIYNRFKRKEIRLMVATDIASRGLDFSHVSHVINYDFPRQSETYTHRTGRTARMGRAGIAMTFVTDRDLYDLKAMLKANRVEPTWHGPAPQLTGSGVRRDRGEASGRPRSRRQPTVQSR